MDPEAREKFRWKFYRLAILLNGVVLLAAAGIVLLFKAPPPFAIPLSVLSLGLAAGLGSYFRGEYRATKRWLESMREGA